MQTKPPVHETRCRLTLKTTGTFIYRICSVCILAYYVSITISSSKLRYLYSESGSRDHYGRRNATSGVSYLAITVI